MNRVQALFGGGQPSSPTPQRPSIWDVLTSLGTLGLAIAALSQSQQYRFWGLLGLAAFALVIRFYQPMAALMSRRRAKYHDNGVAQDALHGLLDMVTRFGELVDNSKGGETLHRALQNAPPDQRLLDRLIGSSSGHWLASMTAELAARVHGDSRDITHFARAHTEFVTLINAYADQCLYPVYQSMPPDLRAQLTPYTRQAIEGFRERYVGFTDAFTKFSKDTASNLSEPRFHPAVPYRPPPFQA